MLGVFFTRRVRLQTGADLDLTPSAHWPQPLVTGDATPDSGPVMITVEYRVDPAQAAVFLAALRALEPARRRDGAFAWGVFRDAAQPGRFLEYFLEDSWLEHLRHHERVTQTDRELQSRVQSFHVGDAAPLVTHFLAADEL